MLGITFLCFHHQWTQTKMGDTVKLASLPRDEHYCRLSCGTDTISWVMLGKQTKHSLTDFVASHRFGLFASLTAPPNPNLTCHFKYPRCIFLPHCSVIQILAIKFVFDQIFVWSHFFIKCIFLIKNICLIKNILFDQKYFLIKQILIKILLLLKMIIFLICSG